MEKLIRGVRKFQADVHGSHAALFRRLAREQRPQALFVTCSDSRVVPDLICQTDPGDLFVLRNPGNLVPPYAPGTATAEAATIEYAVRGLGITDVIVCGHSRCGAMRACLHPGDTADMPRVRQWLGHADRAVEALAARDGDRTDGSRWATLTRENVLVQVGHLRTYPVVAAGAVRLHAWVYEMETGAVLTYDPESCQYVPLVHPPGLAYMPGVGNGA